MKKIPLTKGKFALVDDEDYIFLNRFSWQYQFIRRQEMVKTTLHSYKKDICLYMEFFLTKNKSPKENKGISTKIIHKNRNNLDFRKENLILVPSYIVAGKSRKKLKNFLGKKPSSKYKCVFWNKRKDKWLVKMTYKGKVYCEKTFDKKDEKGAGLFYNEKARELYGEFAYQNKI